MDDDPWDWDTDRVVKELCTPERSWIPKYSSAAIPDPENLEENLRANEVDGFGLLEGFDPETMREYGLKAHVQRLWLQCAIDQFRERSPRYSRKHAPQSVNPPANRASHLPQQAEILDALPEDRKRPASEHSELLQVKKRKTVPEDQIYALNGIHLNGTGSDASDEGFTEQASVPLEKPIKKQKRIAPTFVGPIDPDRKRDSPTGAEDAFNYGLNTVADSPKKERKRIAPTFVGPIDESRKRDSPTSGEGALIDALAAADVDLHDQTQSDPVEDHANVHDTPTAQPGNAFVDDAGKKRMVLVPLDLQHEHTSDEQALIEDQELDTAKTLVVHRKSKGVDQTKEILAQGYLGKQKMPLDEIFYGPGLLESENDENEIGSFQIQGQSISSGRRLYVHSAMKRFLRQNNALQSRKIISRNGNSYSAILPYSISRYFLPGYARRDRLIPEHHDQSFTLLYSSPNGEVHASRQELSEWPEFATEEAEDRTRDWPKAYVTDIPDLLLEKYQNLPGGETVLPVYGESDSEDEFDYDTWKEMHEEDRTLDKATIISRLPPMPVEAVNSAIDGAIAELMLKWKSVKLPRLAAKEWAVYRKYRRLGNKHRRYRIRKLQEEISHLNDDRIPKQRKQIVGEQWTRPQQVHKQAMGSMEVTIFDRQQKLWEFQVLNSKTAPQKPASDESKAKKEKSTLDLAEGEEEIPSESEHASDDEFDGFIDDDNDLEDMDAEIDDGDDESSDWSENDKNGNSSVVTGTGHDNVPGPIPVDESMDDEAQLTTHPAANTAPQAGKSSSPDSYALIDLTMISDSAAEDHSKPKQGESSLQSAPESPQCGPESIDLVTPKKDAGKKLTARFNGAEDIIFISSDSDSPSSPLLPNADELPPYHDTAKIAKLSFDVLERLADRNRLIIAWLHKMQPKELRMRVLAEFQNTEEALMWTTFKDVLQVMLWDQQVPGMNSSVFETYTSIIRALKMYVDCKFQGPYRKKDGKYLGFTEHLVSELETKGGHFHDLYELVQSFAEGLESDEEEDDEDEDDEDGEPILPRPKRISPYGKSSGTDEDLHLDSDPVLELEPDLVPNSSRKRKLVENEEDLHLDSDPFLELEPDLVPNSSRKRKLVENKEARELRESNKERIEQQHRRRQELQAKLASQGISTTSDSTHIIINEGKHDDEGFVYIDETIGKRIKTHQIAGVRFMWEQIVTDAKNMQGCLLAHTMGLGKTMQVITLLVAIAEAAKSEDESVSKQIPPSLRFSRTLVLCPPGIVDNWEDELLTWAPQQTLGDPYKVTSQVETMNKRLEIIEEWYEAGGVLILGYDMFRTLLDNRATKLRQAPLDEEGLQTLRTQLLDGPNIIIADEAHKLKNPKAKISLLASQFRSNSRIALTGSPLNNNVEEYHTMIDWVAPNYLGPISEFRSKYKEPIEAGLWVDSDAAQRRLSKKMLAVLISDLELKVNRANMGVLRNDLPPKKEFVLRIALTKLQKEAYILYVRHMRDGRALDYIPLTKEGHIPQHTLWSWLSVLSLLCNHPGCFKNKIEELTEGKSAGAHRTITGGNARNPNSDEEEDPRNEDNQVASMLGTAILQANMNNSMTELLNSVEDIMDPTLSNKMTILSKILDECREIGDKVLVFTQSIPTLDLLENGCIADNRRYQRLDGKTNMGKRQTMTKEFNTGSSDVLLISTQAGGLGLNLFAANRVIIFDFRYNPTQEEQAIGRAYRIGQVKSVFVYRFVMSGTFEEKIENKAVYKMQLASRVVDKESPIAWAKRRAAEYLVDPEEAPQQDLTQFLGEDPAVLDKILNSPSSASSIRSILKTDTFAETDDEDLTAEDREEVEVMRKDAQLKRQDPEAYQKMLKKRRSANFQAAKEAATAAKAAEIAAHRNKQLEYNQQVMIRQVAVINEALALRAQRDENRQSEGQSHGTTGAKPLNGGARDIQGQIPHRSNSQATTDANAPNVNARINTAQTQHQRNPRSQGTNKDPIPGGFTRTQEDVNQHSEPRTPASGRNKPKLVNSKEASTKVGISENEDLTQDENDADRAKRIQNQGTPKSANEGIEQERQRRNSQTPSGSQGWPSKSNSQKTPGRSLLADLPAPSMALDVSPKKFPDPEKKTQPAPSYITTTPRKAIAPNAKVSKGSIFKNTSPGVTPKHKTTGLPDISKTTSPGVEHQLPLNEKRKALCNRLEAEQDTLIKMPSSASRYEKDMQKKVVDMLKQELQELDKDIASTSKNSPKHRTIGRPYHMSQTTSPGVEHQLPLSEKRKALCNRLEVEQDTLIKMPSSASRYEKDMQKKVVDMLKQGLQELDEDIASASKKSKEPKAPPRSDTQTRNLETGKAKSSMVESKGTDAARTSAPETVMAAPVVNQSAKDPAKKAISNMDGTADEDSTNPSENSSFGNASRRPFIQSSSTASPRGGSLIKPASSPSNSINNSKDSDQLAPATPAVAKHIRLPSWAATGVRDANTPGARERRASRALSRAPSYTPSRTPSSSRK